MSGKSEASNKGKLNFILKKKSRLFVMLKFNINISLFYFAVFGLILFVLSNTGIANEGNNKLSLGSIKYHEEEHYLILENSRLKAVFDKSDFLNISVLIDKKSKQELISKDISGKRILWRIELRDRNGAGFPFLTRDWFPEYRYQRSNLRQEELAYLKDVGEKDVFLDNRSESVSLTSRIEHQDDRINLYLIWQGLKVYDRKSITVEAKITVKNNDDAMYWRIMIRNDDKEFGIWHLEYPILHINKLGDDTGADTFIYPKGKGRIFHNPFKTVKRIIVACYPQSSGQTMQFSAYYDERNGRGIYLAIHDSFCNRKIFLYDFGKSNTLGFKIAQFPMRAGIANIDYQMKFPFVFKSYEGNWYQACRIYRRWAVKQIWCRKGKLSERTDIADFHLKSPVMFTYHTECDEAVAKFPILCEEFNEFFRLRTPCLCALYKWQHYDYRKTVFYELYKNRREHPETNTPTSVVHCGAYLPPRKHIKEAIAKAKKNNIYVMPYVNSRLYDLKNDDAKQVQQYVMHDVNGLWRQANKAYPVYHMCRYTDFWINRYISICNVLIKQLGAESIYVDEYIGQEPPCFSKNHGHIPGIGNLTFQNGRKFGTSVRNALKKLNSNIALMGENSAEFVIDLAEYDLLHYDIAPGCLPLKQAVYHDYWLSCGRSILNDKEDMNPNSNQFFIKLGTYLTEGSKIGRIELSNISRLISNLPERADILKRAANIKQLAYRFLTLGKMLKPLKFNNTIGTITNIYRKKIKVMYPVIMSSVWLSPENHIGIILFNISGQNRKYDFNISKPNYPLSKNQYNIFELSDREDKKLISNNQSLPLEFTGTLKPYEIRFFIIQ